MELIKLTKGQFAQVDNWNYDWLNQWKWYADKHPKTYYARRDVYINGKRKSIYMHRLIMNTPDNMEADHQDHNGLNCQEYNMRNATHRQNLMNQTSKLNGTSKYLGVCIRTTGAQKGLITAQISMYKKKLFLGDFKSETLAAQAYDKAALKYFGEFANLNFK